MVNQNTGLPEPPAHDSDLSPSNGMVIVENESDEEENTYEGYERLPINAEDNEPAIDESSEEEEDVNGENAGAEALPTIEPIEDTLLKEVWSNAPPKDIEMDSHRIDEVKQAMLNFSLPPSNIPEWANHVPEEQWKEQIFRRLENK